MGTTTFGGPVQSEAGFKHISRAAATGVVTELSGHGVGLTTTAGTGITGGTGTVFKASVSRDGQLVVTRIFLDLTGLRSTAIGDIIGVNGTTNACHLGRITAAQNGTIVGGTLQCVETPAGGNADIDLYSATEATGVEDQAITALAETQLTNSGSLTAGGTVGLTAVPAADQYLYLVSGALTDADFTAGQILITLYGYDA